MKNAFTLIELLAVIIIMAIISLIAIPIILDVINNSKTASQKESIDLYGKAVEHALSSYLLEHDEDEERKEIIHFNDIKKYIKYKGNKVECGIHKIYNDNKIFLSSCKVDNQLIDYEYGNKKNFACEMKEEYDSENVTLGDKYICSVNDATKYDFYVLSVDDKVSLIMDKNICKDGTTNYTSSNNYCKYTWRQYSGDFNYYGPVTAMSRIYEATSSWNSIPNINFDYIDEQNSTSETFGYIGIKTEGNTTTIIGKRDITGNINNSDMYIFENLKARLPKVSELQNAGCKFFSSYSDYTSCPVWLVVNLSKYQGGVNASKYEINNNSTSPHDSYWTLSSHNDGTCCSKTLSNYGIFGAAPTTMASGIRPVIEVNKNDLDRYY